MKIIDCFTFYNELDLLEYRLSTLKDTVDYFVLVEATLTHVGKPKKCYFQEHREKFKEYPIIHIVVNDLSNSPDISKDEQWDNERHQRNCIKHGIKQIKDLGSDDLIIISDLDEIPDPRTLMLLKDFNQDIDGWSLEQDFYYYNLNSLMSIKWYYPKIISYSNYLLMDITLSELRYKNSNYIKKGGWHLSYFGTPEFISNKIKNFAHQEFNDPTFTSELEIQKRIEQKLDLFKRNETQIINLKLEENKYLPINWTRLFKQDSFI